MTETQLIKLSPFIDYPLWARHCSAHVFPISYIPGFPLSKKINFSWKLKEMILLITLRHRSKWWCMVCIHNACPFLINESSAMSELCSSSEPFMVIMEIFVTDIKEFHIPLRLCFFIIIITIEMSQFPMVFFMLWITEIKLSRTLWSYLAISKLKILSRLAHSWKCFAI